MKTFKTFTKTQKILEIIAFSMLVLMFLYLCAVYPGLPERLPSHYNSHGVADAYGAKSTIFVAPIAALILYVLISIVSRFPSAWNIPVKLTDRNRDKIHNMVLNLLCFLKVILIFIFSYLLMCTANSSPLSVLFLPFILIILFGSIIITIISIIKAR